MKRNISILIILLITVQLLGQVKPNLDFNKDYYLQRSKNQNTSGWVLLSTGVVLTVIGIVGFSNSDFLESNSNSDFYGLLMLGGTVTSLVSIPLFINSGYNARKAATLSVNNSSFIFQNQGSLAISLQPSLSLKIKLK
jgi:hypothetical protein